MAKTRAAEEQKELDDIVMGSLEKPSRGYFLLIGACLVVIVFGVTAFMFQYFLGMIVTGLSIPVSWAVYITNFVFWIGIAHAGTLISAILFLFRTAWRNRINRATETMTIFAIFVAGIFPLIHLGRVWVFWWILPYPNWRHLWPNFKSPLVFDVIAVTTYLTASALFLYLGMIPDLATTRDRTEGGWRKRFYTKLALGWTGEYDQWRHHTRAYLALASLITPLVISVHSVVSWDFAMAILPGWHSTIFAPYFVAGAIHSGLAMAITLLVPLRRVLRLERLLTPYYFEQMALLMVFTASILAYSYGVEGFMSWYSGDRFERQFASYRSFRSLEFTPFFWLMLLCNTALPMVFVVKRLRTSLAFLFVASLVVNLGMWLERFVIITASLSHGFLPSSWGLYAPRTVEITITLMAAAMFLVGILIFLKLFPAIPITEAKKEFLEGD